MYCLVDGNAFGVVTGVLRRDTGPISVSFTVCPPYLAYATRSLAREPSDVSFLNFTPSPIVHSDCDYCVWKPFLYSSTLGCILVVTHFFLEGRRTRSASRRRGTSSTWAICENRKHVRHYTLTVFISTRGHHLVLVFFLELVGSGFCSHRRRARLNLW